MKMIEVTLSFEHSKVTGDKIKIIIRVRGMRKIIDNVYSAE
jgi:hypothetical protein